MCAPRSAAARRHFAGHGRAGRRRRKGCQGRPTAAEEQLKVLGVDKDHPSPVVNVYAPISGVIIAQNVTNAAAAGVTPFRLGHGLHDCRLGPGLDPLRCLRKRPSQSSPWPGGADSSQCLSRPGADRAHQRYRPRARSHHPHGQGPHRGSKSGHPQARHVCHRDLYQPQESRPTPSFRPMPCFICTIATGSMCPPATISSGASKCTPEKCSTATPGDSVRPRTRSAGCHQRSAA